MQVPLRVSPGLALALLVAPLSTQNLLAQNLVTNGDFGSGKTTGWTLGGYTVSPKVMNYDTTGTGPSQSFSNRPGSKGNTTPPAAATRWSRRWP